MPQILKDHVAEALAGLAVIALAAWFLLFALGRTGTTGADSYELKARFPNASGISVGSDVRVSGLKVGSVTAQVLDPATTRLHITHGEERFELLLLGDELLRVRTVEQVLGCG